MQEMNVKVDKGFIISMAGLFSQQKELLEEVLLLSVFKDLNREVISSWR